MAGRFIEALRAEGCVVPATVAMDVPVRRKRGLRAVIATWPPVNVFHLDDYDRQVA